MIRLITAICTLLCMNLYCFSQMPSHYDVIIDEIFADPSPSVGLPDAEFIELKNISPVAYDLHNWTISNRNNTAAVKINFVLQPDSFVIICPSAAADSYSLFGAAIGITGFPALNNNSDIISLKSSEGITVHAVQYDQSWYQNDIKINGGWTLEMIDTKNACSGYSNWRASTDEKGGTPGKKNSIDASNPDQQPPALLRTYAIDSTTIIAVFDEALDSATAAIASNYKIDNNIGSPSDAVPIAPLFNEVRLRLPVKLNSNIIYRLVTENITDCSGNKIGVMNSSKAGISNMPDTMDIVINEILFNPKTNGYDYVELYNRNNKIIDLKQLYIANRDITGSLNSSKQISSSPFLFFPGEYFVATENSLWLQQNYNVKNPDKIIELPALPSMPDDRGDIVLLNQRGDVIDELKYDHSWQFALLDNESGVALERIDYTQPTQDKNNWTSAASTAGFGTPTYQNSEFKSDQQPKAEISIEPKTFSPDNDGYNDYCFINYQTPEPGYVVNITIYDASGRPVRYLANNTIVGIKGNFRWDGLDDKQKTLPVGAYIIVTEIFNLKGRTKKFKNVIVLAKKF